MEPHEIAAYAEGNLDAAARERAEVHLADCASCRADALAALRARDRAPLGTRWVPPALAAAAIVALLVSRTGHGAIPFARERVAPPPTAVALAAPETGAILRATNLRLVWRSVRRAADYRVSVTDEKGTQVFLGSTRDTVFTVPAAALAAGSAFLWGVDAVLPDGSVIVSGARMFVIRP